MQIASHCLRCICTHIALQSKIVILAGYKTAANTSAYCIYLLSKTPTTQQQKFQVVDQVQPGQEDLDMSPFVRSVINEALQLLLHKAFTGAATTSDIATST